MQVREQQRRAINGQIESVKTTLLPDANGGWQVHEVGERTVKEDGQNRTTDERISRRDFEGNVSLATRVVTRDSVSNGQATRTSETYSIDLPGSTRDGKLHLTEQSASVQTRSHGRTTTEQHISEPDPGDPQRGLSVSTKTKDVVVAGQSGTEKASTVSARDPDGNFNVVSVEIKKLDNVPAIQIQIAPPDNPK